MADTAHTSAQVQVQKDIKVTKLHLSGIILWACNFFPTAYFLDQEIRTNECYYFSIFLILKLLSVCLLTLVSEGGGGGGRGNGGSRSRDGTLANRLLHDTPLFHLVHHILYRETTGEMMQAGE